MTLGFIALHRKMLEWEWFDNPNVLSVFLFCLLNANHKAKIWRGVNIDRGSFLTSIEKISQGTGLTFQQVRTAINKLKSTNELTSKSTSRNTVIIINNWNAYQEINKQVNNQITNKQQTNNKQITTTNNDNNVNNIEEEEENFSNFENQILDLENWHGEYKNVRLTSRQKSKLLGIVSNEKAVDALIEDLSRNIAMGKVKLWSEELPDIHYERLCSYWRYRKQHPEKFKQPTDSTTSKTGDLTNDPGANTLNPYIR